jgi:hypothetical protein
MLYAPFPSPMRAACHAHLILLDLIIYTFVNSKDWVKLQLTLFSSNTLSSVYYISMSFVVLTAAFQRIQVICVDAVSCGWVTTFRTVVLKSFETSGTTHQKTQRILPENLTPHFTDILHVNVS